MRIVIVIVIMLVVFASAVFALPAYFQMFKKIEKPPANSALEKAYCLTCHKKPAGGKELNPYGADFKKNGKSEAALKKIEPLDSDGDGATNKAETTKGTLPGDKTSKP